MKQSMRALIDVLNRVMEYPSGEQPIFTSVFKIGNTFHTNNDKEEARKNLKELEEKGWIKMHSDPFNSTGEHCGRIFECIPDPDFYKKITKTNDVSKQEKLNQAFKEIPKMDNGYSDEIWQEILRGGINNQFIQNSRKIDFGTISIYGDGRLPAVNIALKEWESKGLLKILKNPQEIVDDQEICVEALKFID